jgi:excisionase family DNA binding protein
MQSRQTSLTFGDSSHRLAFSVNEAAAALGLSASSIWKWISLGKLRAIRIGGRTLITVEEVKRVLTIGIK